MEQTNFNIELYVQPIQYGPSQINLDTFTCVFGPYQYGQDYLDTTCTVSGMWIVDGVPQYRLNYFTDEVIRLGNDVISQWGVDDTIIVSASAAHFGYTVIFE